MKILAIALLCVWVGGAAAQEERAIDNFAGVGVRAMGMGGAFVGVADDFTAMYWNPAGLAQMQRREVQVSLLRNSRANDSVFNGHCGEKRADQYALWLTGLCLSLSGLSRQLGLGRWPDPHQGLRLEPQSQRRRRRTCCRPRLPARGPSWLWRECPQPSTCRRLFHWVRPWVWSAVKTRPSMSLTGRIRRTKFLEQRFFARDSFTDEYQWTPYAVLGAMLRTPRDNPRYRLGATFTTGGTHKIRYVFRGSPSDRGYSSVQYDDGTVEKFSDEEARNTYELTLPFEFGVGASAEALQGLTLAGSLHLAEWSQSEYKGADDHTACALTPRLRLSTRDVLRYHFGVEYQVPVVALDLRAGYFVDPVPFIGPRDPGSDDPTIRIEEDRRFITLGAGILLDEASPSRSGLGSGCV